MRPQFAGRIEPDDQSSHDDTHAHAVADQFEQLMGVSDDVEDTPHARAVATERGAVPDGKRAAATPDVPTLAEQGLGDFDESFWYGVAVAAGKLFIADTNNHRICTADLETGRVEVFSVAGLKPPAPERPAESLTLAECEAIIAASTYLMKSPPVQMPDDEGRARVEAFIRGEVDR